VLNSDYKDMLQVLLDNGVKFLLVGAYAMGVHGYPRATGDIDIWVEPTRKAVEQGIPPCIPRPAMVAVENVRPLAAAAGEL
jgi:hypothetical protein